MVIEGGRRRNSTRKTRPAGAQKKCTAQFFQNLLNIAILMHVHGMINNTRRAMKYLSKGGNAMSSEERKLASQAYMLT
jgi:hypothetical protein